MTKISQNSRLWYLLIVLFLLLLAPQLYVLPASKSLLDWFRYGLVPALLFFMLLLALSRKLQRGIWLLLPVALLVPQELFYLITYHKPTDAHALAIIFETDLNEAAGYLAGLEW